MTFYVYTTLYNNPELLEAQLQGQYAEVSYQLGDYNLMLGGRPVAITVESAWDDEHDDTFFHQLLLHGLIGLYRVEDDKERKDTHG